MAQAATGRQLSVVILARDAADPLRLTLASVREMADEILVVDTGSQDRTREVAREFGARVEDFAWVDDFAAARNFALTRATGDWLLWLDAGETVSESMAVGIHEQVTQVAGPRAAYWLLVRLPPQGAHSTPEQIAQIRLMPRLVGVRFEGRVWESPEKSLRTLGLEIEGLPLVIQRGERDHDIRVKKQRARRNLRLAELELQTQANLVRCWNCIGDSWQTLGEHAKAVDCFRRSLALAQRGSSESLVAHYGLLTSLESSTRQEQDALVRQCVRALEEFPLDAQLLCAMGGYLLATDRLPLAAQAYHTAYRYGQVNPTVWHVADIREVAASCYCLALQLQHHLPSAIDFLEEALREDAAADKLRRRLIELYIQQGTRELALSHVGKLSPTTPHLEALRSAVRGACFAVQQNLIAGKAYLQAAYSHGCRDPICLKWLSICLLANQDWDGARDILREWQAIEPHNVEATKLLASCAPPTEPTPPASPQLRIDAPNAAGGTSQPLKLNLPNWYSASSPNSP